MKKLSLVLGSLLIAATASAKEVVPAPVVVPEPVVVEECLVCDIPQFQPTGYFSVEGEYRGNSETGGADKKRFAATDKNHANVVDGHNRGRSKEHVFLEVLGAVAVTPKDTISFRARDYMSVINESDSQYVGNEHSGKTDLRLRWDHKMGQVFGTKVTFTPGIEARLHKDYQAYTLLGKFEFKDYFSNNGFYKTDSFAIVPKVRYTDFDNLAYFDRNDKWVSGHEAYAVGTGVDFNHLGSMDLGSFGTLETELNVMYLYSETNSRAFGQQNAYGGAQSPKARKNGDYRYTGNGNTTYVEAYLYHTLPLWSSDSNRYIVQFYQEGGVDGMAFDHRSSDNAEAVVYYEPKIQLVQHINTATSLTYSAGAYYENNWSNGTGDVGKFEWEPRAGVKLKTKF